MSAPTLSRTPASPPAVRSPRPGWRDPRLAAGVALVAGCALLGARLLGSADDTVAVWALRGDAIAGERLDVSDLRQVRLRFADGVDADRYVSSDDQIAAGTVLTRAVDAGELLPRSALGNQSELDLVELPVTLPSPSVPATLEAGALVDVWVTPADADLAVLVLERVRVLALPADEATFGASGDRQVILGLARQDQSALPEALALLTDGTIVLTSRAGR